MKHFCALAVAMAVTAMPGSALAVVKVLAPGDFVIPIDADSTTVGSIYPATEAPQKAIDNFWLQTPTNPQTATKYLNFGRINTGLIIDPAGSPQVQSFAIHTANDNEPRDPATYQLWGSNDAAILSADNSTGEAETWTLISSGALNLPSTRRASGPVVSITNPNSYNLYRIVFPTLKAINNATAMQIGEVEFFSTTDGSGGDILDPDGLDPIRAIKRPSPALGESIIPATQGPEMALDGNPNTKYLNFGILNTGFIVTPSRGATAVNGFQITTGNDTPGRDPTSYQIYGTNDAIQSAAHSQGTGGENWTLISSGAITLPAGSPTPRLTSSPVINFTNATTYTSYKIIFPTVTGPASLQLPPPAGDITSMQVADVQFFADGTDLPGDFNLNGKTDYNDFMLWQRQFGSNEAGVVSDANGDNTVNELDLTAWAGGLPSVAAGVTVPEPYAALLAVIAALTLARRRTGLALATA